MDYEILTENSKIISLQIFLILAWKCLLISLKVDSKFIEHYFTSINREGDWAHVRHIFFWFLLRGTKIEKKYLKIN